MSVGVVYRGRFAPSPTGALHAGSMVAALASWLDARAHGGRWLVRIEDVDSPRCVPGAEAEVLRQLAACGLLPDEPPLRQSERSEIYAESLQRLLDAGLAYGCRCTRREIALAQAAAGLRRERHGELVYPGTCRPQPVAGSGQATGSTTSVALGAAPTPSDAARAVRLLTLQPDGTDVVIDWHDRALGAQRQNLSCAVGDFVLRRADGLWAYQLAVVVDDAAQGISHVVRGADLADNTPRQLWLQCGLGLPTPRYLHTPLVLGANGEKLSKQNGAAAVEVREPRAVLWAAAAALGLVGAQAPPATLAELQALLVAAWSARWHDAQPRGRQPTPINTRGLVMTTTASGLQYDDTVPGTGATATAGNNVTVHYTGWLSDPTQANGRGRKFDSSKDRNDPFRFKLGAGQVIRGWDEGVQGMQIGGTRVLTIPAELGYGARGAGGVIPPNATLVFEVELLGV